MFHIGEALTGSDYRVRGAPPESVRKRCTLVFSNVAMGSFHATLELEDQQGILDGTPLGEETISTFHDLVEKIETSEEPEAGLNRILTDRRHRARIISDFSAFWPEEREGHALSFEVPGLQKITMSPSRRLVLDGLEHRLEAQEITSVRGVLGTLKVAPGKRKIMRVIGPDGQINCLMTIEHETTARKLLGKPVMVSGEADFDAVGNPREIVDVKRIEPFKEIQLQRIFSETSELKLAAPLIVGVDFREDHWVMEYEDLGIISTNTDYEGCFKEFNEDFLFVWAEYGSAEDAGLTEGARELKRKITEIVRGSSQ
jgi:hypothetical protein